MKNSLKCAAAILALCASPVHADVTLTYELNGPEMEPRTKTISISRFFARIDDSAEPDTYLIFQAGKFFPLFRVDKAASTYTRLTPKVNPTLHAGQPPKAEAGKEKPTAEKKESKPTGEKAIVEKTDVNTSAEPAAKDDTLKTEPKAEQTAKDTATHSAGKGAKDDTKPKTTLRLTKKNQEIAGVQCRLVEELTGDKTGKTHCMAAKARLGITERETRTLSRVFALARKRNWGWLGTATTDEQFVSVATQDPESKKTLMLKTVSTDPLPVGHLRIPKNFKEVPLK